MRTYTIVGMVAFAISGLLLACNDEGTDQPYRSENVGETVTGEEVNTLENIPDGLALVNYTLDPNVNQLSGSLMNNSNVSFVNVQVEFDLYNSQNELVASVRDTTSEVQPGDTWQFGMAITPDEAAVRAVPVEVQGIPRPMADGQTETSYPQNNPSVSAEGEPVEGPVQPPPQN